MRIEKLQRILKGSNFSPKMLPKWKGHFKIFTTKIFGYLIFRSCYNIYSSFQTYYQQFEQLLDYFSNFENVQQDF